MKTFLSPNQLIGQKGKIVRKAGRPTYARIGNQPHLLHARAGDNRPLHNGERIVVTRTHLYNDVIVDRI